MVDCHPSQSIVNFGSASAHNVSSGWQSTMAPRKEWDIYILLYIAEFNAIWKLECILIISMKFLWKSTFPRFTFWK